MNVEREKHNSKNMGRKPLQDTTSGSESPSARRCLITHQARKPQKSSPDAPENDSDDDSSSTGKDLQSGTPRYYFNTEIPERYNETYIIAIPKDPNWLYVYWEFSDETAHLMDSNLEQSGSKLVLRLKETDVADTYEEIMPFQVEISDLSTGQYVPVPENSGEFQIECGIFSEKEGFVPVAKSEPVTIPQSDTTGQIFDIFASDEEKKSTLFDTVNDQQVESSSAMQSDHFNSQTSTSYSKPFPCSAGSIF